MIVRCRHVEHPVFVQTMGIVGGPGGRPVIGKVLNEPLAVNQPPMPLRRGVLRHRIVLFPERRELVHHRVTGDIKLLGVCVALGERQAEHPKGVIRPRSGLSLADGEDKLGLHAGPQRSDVDKRLLVGDG